MNFILDVIKGVVVGIANVIPGVSGGTMAVSMHIYDKLITALTHIFSEFKKSVKILFPYLLGMALGIIGLSFFIEFLYDVYPIQTNFAFIGLILGGIPPIVVKIKHGGRKPVNIGLFLVFFACIIGLQLISARSFGEVSLTGSVGQAGILFLVGVIASATMVIPGVSGSMILMILGFYRPIIETINKTVLALTAFDVPGVINGAAILAPFGIGIVVGIFAIAKGIELLLNKYETATYFAITGLVVASPIALVMGLDFTGAGWMTAVSSLITALVGFAIPFKVFSRLD